MLASGVSLVLASRPWAPKKMCSYSALRYQGDLAIWCSNPPPASQPAGVLVPMPTEERSRFCQAYPPRPYSEVAAVSLTPNLAATSTRLDDTSDAEPMAPLSCM